jgi:hypothetical protein
MTAPFYVPFNFNTTSTTIKSASYTIPANKYAKVTAYFIGTKTGTAQTITQDVAQLNGVDVLYSPFVSKISPGTFSPSTTIFTIPSTASGKFSFKVSFSATATTGQVRLNGINIDIADYTNGRNIEKDFECSGSETITTTVGLNVYANGAIVGFTPYLQTFEAWVPTGTVLNCSGVMRWKVEEYNSIV